ncbi:hypothetical protein D3C87_1890930 [compost metagenome]
MLQDDLTIPDDTHDTARPPVLLWQGKDGSFEGGKIQGGHGAQCQSVGEEICRPDGRIGFVPTAPSMQLQPRSVSPQRKPA